MHRARRGVPVGVTMFVLAFAGIVITTSQTMVIPMLDALPAFLHTTPANTAWVVTATLLTGAVAMPIIGRLGDMYGRRRLLLVAMAFMVAGSLVCAATSSIAVMVAGRVLQGVAMSVIPLGISLLSDLAPKERRTKAISYMSTSFGVGGAAGLPAFAALAEVSNPHVLFLCGAVLAALAFVAAVLLVPGAHKESEHGRFDFVGAVGLCAGLVCVLLAISKGADWGWTSGTTIAVFAAGVVVLLGWGVLELRTRDPLVDLRVSARRQVLFTNLTAIFVGASFMVSAFVGPRLLQIPTSTGYGSGTSMVVAGLSMAPSGLTMVVASPLGSRLIDSIGAKRTLGIGLGFLAAAYAVGQLLLGGVWQITVFSTMVGFGIGIAFACMPTLIMDAVPAAEKAAANGLNSLMRSIGTSTLSAVAGAVLATMTVTVGSVQLPSLEAFRVLLAIACGIALLGLLLSFLIPGRSTTAYGPPPTPTS